MCVCVCVCVEITITNQCRCKSFEKTTTKTTTKPPQKPPQNIPVSSVWRHHQSGLPPRWVPESPEAGSGPAVGWMPRAQGWGWARV